MPVYAGRNKLTVKDEIIRQKPSAVANTTPVDAEENEGARVRCFA